MEAVVVIAIIAVILVILGISLTSVAIGLLALSIFIVTMMLFFFVAAFIAMLICKREEGRFDGFEKPHGYDTAMYKCGEDRFRNIFPAETILRGRIYTDRPVTLMIRRGKKHSYAIDRHSCVIILFGLALSAASMIGLFYEINSVI